MNHRPPFRELRRYSTGSPTFELQRFRSIHGDLLRLLSLCIPITLLVVLDGARVVAYLVLSIAVTTIWQCAFARAQGHRLGVDLLTTSLLFTFLLPPGLTQWQLILAVSFGVVIGEQIFGGRGYSFLHPVITGLAFLLHSFPDSISVVNHQLLTLSLFPGMLILLFYRLIDWRSVLGITLGILFISAVTTKSLAVPLPGSIVLAGITFAALDPAVGTLTRVGRWVYGWMLGSLITFFDPTLQSLQAMVFACLLASVAAPLIDAAVIRVQSYHPTSR